MIPATAHSLMDSLGTRGYHGGMDSTIPEEVARWCSGHQAEIQECAGQYVGISARLGIVAHGLDFAKVHAEARSKDPDAVFEFVPPPGILVV